MLSPITHPLTSLSQRDSLSLLPGFSLRANSSTWVNHPQTALSGCRHVRCSLPPLLGASVLLGPRLGPRDPAAPAPQLFNGSAGRCSPGSATAALRSEALALRPPERRGDQAKGGQSMNMEARLQAPVHPEQPVRCRPLPHRSPGRAPCSSPRPLHTRSGAGTANFMHPARCPSRPPRRPRSCPTRTDRV
ncbi:hypothetical protein NDU88_003055 [Pleurodeles waltl]|uniref:Uncharacterized protein n=1 Tax=Pleurodeles waltl TaxID=8319 RepID=A0AAV7TPW6_PLEWA|nr:hypothetical protein NDU88_003055 [Pleurodeles waltl]